MAMERLTSLKSDVSNWKAGSCPHAILVFVTWASSYILSRICPPWSYQRVNQSYQSCYNPSSYRRIFAEGPKLLTNTEKNFLTKLDRLCSSTSRELEAFIASMCLS